MFKPRNTYKAMLLLILLSATATARAQNISRFDIPENICLGDSVLITFGYDESHNIMYQFAEVSRGIVETVFLPDGISCGSMGCAYTSSVNFNDFAPGAQITSPQAIRYLRLNIEHSYIADLYIALFCPNGNNATIMNFGGAPTSMCYSSIPENARNWNNNHTNLMGYEDLGIPSSYDHGGCNKDQNTPGIGWNYCWSDNTISDYQYASSDGIIYRTGHAHNGRVDSSNVAAHTNFFHPEQNFNSLIGCPLNGEWTVKVIDGYSGDNGYLFSWELALDGNLVESNECPVDSFAVLGPGAVRINDSSYYLTLPANITHDSTVRYIFKIFDECGNVTDTSTFVTFRAKKNIDIHRDVIENNLPYTYNEIPFDDSVSNYIFPLTDRFGCDSIVHFYLNVWRNIDLTLDTSVCSYNLPLVWLDSTFYNSCILHYNLQTVNGADSNVTAIIRVINADTIEVMRKICDGVPYTWIDGITYDDITLSPVYVLHRTPCDSILRLHLSISDEAYYAQIRAYPNPVGNDNYNVTLTDITDSESRIWTIGDRNDTARIYTFVFPITEDSVDVTLFARNRYGCTDSTTLTIRNNTHQFWAPNAFTPDESTNRTFAIATNQVIAGTVYIYSRAGNFITSFDLLTGSWDGTAKGHVCPQGTYIWKADYTTKGSPQVVVSRVGNVTILR